MGALPPLDAEAARLAEQARGAEALKPQPAPVIVDHSGSSRHRWSRAPGNRWNPSGMVLIIAALGGAGGLQALAASCSSGKLDAAIVELKDVTNRLETLEGKQKLRKRQVDTQFENLRLANEVRDKRDKALAKALSQMNGRRFMTDAPKPSEEEVEENWHRALIEKEPLVAKGHYTDQAWPELPDPKPIPEKLVEDED